MCTVRYIKLYNRVLAIQSFPEGICIQQMSKNGKPELGTYLCYPYEFWMDEIESKPPNTNN